MSTLLESASSTSSTEGDNKQQQQQQATTTSTYRDYIGDDGKFKDGWTNLLPDTHKQYAASVSRYPSLPDIVAGYANAEKKISEKFPAPPLPGDAPEKVEAYTAKVRELLGSPDKPEGYELKKPDNMPEGIEWDEAEAGKLAAIAHKHGLTKGAVQDILNMSLEREQGRLTKAKEGLEGYVKGQEKALRDKWGDKYDANIQSAVKAANALQVDITDPDVGSNAKVLEILSKASLLMQQDKMLGGGDGTMKTNVEQIAEIRKGDAYQGKLGPDAQAAAAKRIQMLSGVKA